MTLWIRSLVMDAYVDKGIMANFVTKVCIEIVISVVFCK